MCYRKQETSFLSADWSLLFQFGVFTQCDPFILLLEKHQEMEWLWVKDEWMTDWVKWFLGVSLEKPLICG